MWGRLKPATGDPISFLTTNTTYKIGKSSSNQIVNKTKEISSNHCQIIFENNQPFILDTRYPKFVDILKIILIFQNN